jgi:hypothetical protein
MNARWGKRIATARDPRRDSTHSRPPLHLGTQGHYPPQAPESAGSTGPPKRMTLRRDGGREMTISGRIKLDEHRERRGDWHRYLPRPNQDQPRSPWQCRLYERPRAMQTQPAAVQGLAKRETVSGEIVRIEWYLDTQNGTKLAHMTQCSGILLCFYYLVGYITVSRSLRPFTLTVS